MSSSAGACLSPKNSHISHSCWYSILNHDDVIKWKHFPRNWPFVWGIHRSPVNSPHKGQWRGALMFSLICVWINLLGKKSRDWWFDTPAWSLWRHRNAYHHFLPCGNDGKRALSIGYKSLRKLVLILNGKHKWIRLHIFILSNVLMASSKQRISTIPSKPDITACNDSTFWNMLIFHSLNYHQVWWHFSEVTFSHSAKTSIA